MDTCFVSIVDDATIIKEKRKKITIDAYEIVIGIIDPFARPITTRH